jgi:hypothetical protein
LVNTLRDGSNTTLKKLDLSGIRGFDDDSTSCFATLLSSKNSSLIDLHLAACSLNSSGFTNLAVGLQRNDVLERIDVDGVKITGEGAYIALATFLP